jgi:septum site-determining protein MinD
MIIGIISAKGGVGKTTVTSNLGAVLVKEFNKRVLVIDGNITTPSLGVHLNTLSQEKTLDDVLNGTVNFIDTIYAHPSGLHVVPSSLSPDPDLPDTEKLKEKLEGMKDKYDIILIDAAAGIGREVLSVINASDNVLVVTNPEMTSILGAVKAIKISKALNIPSLGIVLNKTEKGNHKLKTSDVEELCESNVISEIMYDKDIYTSIKNMNPLVLEKSNSPTTKSFRELAAKLLGENITVKKSFWNRIFRF